MPEQTPDVEYDEHEIVRTVPSTKDYISFKGRLWKVPQAFRGERVAIRPRSHDGNYGVFFASHTDRNHRLDQPQNRQLCLRTGVRHVPGLNNKPGDDGPGVEQSTVEWRQRLKPLERVDGIEPTSSAWKAAALPLCYTREINGLGGGQVDLLLTCSTISARR